MSPARLQTFYQEFALGHQAILYGRIQQDWEGTSTPWPFLTRHLFAVAERTVHNSADRGNYRGQVVHFAASIKDSHNATNWPEQFLAKLEELSHEYLNWYQSLWLQSLLAPSEARRPRRGLQSCTAVIQTLFASLPSGG